MSGAIRIELLLRGAAVGFLVLTGIALVRRNRHAGARAGIALLTCGLLPYVLLSASVPLPEPARPALLILTALAAAAPQLL